MTWRARRPTHRNRRQWTSWERSRTDPTRATDLDARSCQTGTGIWPDYLSDVESLTLLAGLDTE